MSEAMLVMKNISKRFGSVVALNQVNLEVYPGEIRGLIGENGSGKSTISSIAAGMQKANEGEMIFQEISWAPANMIDALQKGIGMVVQESGTIPGVTVAENIFLGEMDAFKNKLGIVQKKKLNAKADEVMEAIGVSDVKGSTPMDSLDFQTRKLVEIAKVAMKDPKILVIDETSTALSQDGREIMYNLMNRYRKEGKSVIFISHDLEEIMDVCDTLTVLRDGNLIRTFKREEFGADAIRTSMIGRELEGDYYRSDYDSSHGEKVLLEGTHLNFRDGLKDISISLHEGEILGIGGLASCGMHDLGKALFGEEKRKAFLESDVFFLTSRTEGMPMGLIEALSYGLPAFVTRGSCMLPEIVSNDAGWGCEFDEEQMISSFRRMIADKANYMKKGENALKLSSKYDWDELAKQFHSIISELMKK